jgi:hypothetical protein
MLAIDVKQNATGGIHHVLTASDSNWNALSLDLKTAILFKTSHYQNRRTSRNLNRCRDQM